MSLFDKTTIMKLRDKLGLYSNKKILLSLLICLVIICLDYSLVIRRQLANLKGLRIKITELKSNLDTFQKDAKNMQDLKIRQLAEEKNPALKLQKLIPEDGVSSFLEDISDAANKNEIKIIQIKPSRASPGKEKNALLAKFPILLVSLEAIGSYHALGKFLNDLEMGNYFSEVQSLNISNIGGNYAKQKISLVLRSYVRK
ncbi:MAG: type 4a pilus biogenesis protein PilO [Candidatus Omnitrophota bacterium]